MAAYCWVMRIKPGCFEEYDRKHREVWPDVLQGIRDAGITSFNIFRWEDRLIGVFETDDVGRTVRLITATDANKRWRVEMSKLVEADVDPTTNFQKLLPLVWQLPAKA